MSRSALRRKTRLFPGRPPSRPHPSPQESSRAFQVLSMSGVRGTSSPVHLQFGSSPVDALTPSRCSYYYGPSSASLTPTASLCTQARSKQRLLSAWEDLLLYGRPRRDDRGCLSCESPAHPTSSRHGSPPERATTSGGRATWAAARRTTLRPFDEHVPPDTDHARAGLRQRRASPCP